MLVLVDAHYIGSARFAGDKEGEKGGIDESVIGDPAYDVVLSAALRASRGVASRAAR